MSMFYAEVCIEEFGVGSSKTDHPIWVRFSPQPMSSVARKESNGTNTYDIVFQTESPQDVKPEKDPPPEKAFICHQDAYFCFTGEAVGKILTGPALLLCKQQRLKLKVYVEETEFQKNETPQTPPINGQVANCIMVADVVFQ